MSLKDQLLEKVDADKNGKVSVAEVAAALDAQFGATKWRFATGGFIAGILVTVLAFVAK